MEQTKEQKYKPYSLTKNSKKEYLNKELNALFRHHSENCSLFKKSMDAIGYCKEKDYDYWDLPFLPVRLFKLYDLKSIEDGDVIKTLTSSGTSGQSVSKIYLDKTASANQIKTLSKIVTSFTGGKRQPMLIIDTKSVLKNRASFSARGAGILGFSVFGKDHTYCLDEDMKIDLLAIQDFIKRHNGEKIFIFGFTFMIYQHFYKSLAKENITLDLSNATLIHGGGWKKMINEAINSSLFRRKLKEVCEIENVYDYYGMVEQTGTIYMECEEGHLHASDFSDIIIRRESDFSEASVGEKGIVQVISVLPKSYPGQSLLTEDEGVLLGEDNCKCGRKGKYFKILGRIKSAELRGCSDTYGAKF